MTSDSDCLVDFGVCSLFLLFLAFDADLAEVVGSVAEIADLSASWTGFVSESVYLISAAKASLFVFFSSR